MKKSDLDTILIFLDRPTMLYPMPYSDISQNLLERLGITDYILVMALEKLSDEKLILTKYSKTVNPKTGEKTENLNDPFYFLSYEGYLLIHLENGDVNHQPYTKYINNLKTKSIKYEIHNTAPIIVAIIAIAITLWQVLSDKEKFELEKKNQAQQETIRIQKQAIEVLTRQQ